IATAVRKAVTTKLFRERYADVFDGGAAWKKIKVKTGSLTYQWDIGSTYVQQPHYFSGMKIEPAPITDVKGARVLGLFGDSITTDHISPARHIQASTPPP